MNPTELLERTRQLWPAEMPTDNDFLNDFYWPLEDRIMGDDWLQLGVWSFHQALGVHAEAARSCGETTISSLVVTLEDFDFRVRRNLRNDSWDELRPLYGQP